MPKLTRKPPRYRTLDKSFGGRGELASKSFCSRVHLQSWPQHQTAPFDDDPVGRKMLLHTFERIKYREPFVIRDEV